MASGSGNTMTVLPTLFQIDKLYPPGSDNHYCFCFLADPFVGGPSRVDLPSKRLSTMKKVFEKQYKEETISLMRMIFLDCGDKNSSDLLKEFDSSMEISFTGRTVEEDTRETYNFRCLLMNVASKLDSTQTNDMVTYLKEEIGYELARSDFQTILLLFVRAHQGSIILPQKLDRLKQWLAVFNRDDLIRYVDQFEPRKQFPGLRAPISESGAIPSIQRQCSDTTGQISTTVPVSPQSVGAAGSLATQPNSDVAYAEEERSGSHSDSQSLGTDKSLQEILPVNNHVYTKISDVNQSLPVSSHSAECRLQCQVFNKCNGKQLMCHSLCRDIKMKVTNKVQPGTQIFFRVSSSESSYVYIINIGSSGNITTLIPNDCDHNNHLQSGQYLQFPSPKSEYEFELDENCGKETVVVMAYSEPLSNVEQAQSDYADLVKQERDIRIVKKHSLERCIEIQFTVSQ